MSHSYEPKFVKMCMVELIGFACSRSSMVASAFVEVAIGKPIGAGCAWFSP